MKVTISPAQPSPQDIFKPGSLVMHKDDNWVVLVTEWYGDDDVFSGVTIDSPHRRLGHHANDWSKCMFVKFVGSVLLEQE